MPVSRTDDTRPTDSGGKIHQHEMIGPGAGQHEVAPLGRPLDQDLVHLADPRETSSACVCDRTASMSRSSRSEATSSATWSRSRTAGVPSRTEYLKV